MQAVEVARPVGLRARRQDHVVRPLDMRDGIDLHEAQPVDLVRESVARRAEGAVVRAGEPLQVQHEAAGRPKVEDRAQIGWIGSWIPFIRLRTPLRSETNRAPLHSDCPPKPFAPSSAAAPDANGRPPERAVSDGDGNPCRHCLAMIEEGAEMLVLAHRPFATVNPYAEVGPIFLHARECEPFRGKGAPPVLASPTYLVRGYGADERIVYGTGAGDGGGGRGGAVPPLCWRTSA